jgi:hypothetical protein
MLVRKVRGQNKIGKVTLLVTEVALARKLGVSLEEYVKAQLMFIAKKRKWKWFFDKEQQGA